MTCGEPRHGDLVVVPGLGVSAYLRASVEHAGASGYRTWLPDLVNRVVLGSPTIDPKFRSWPKALVRWRRDGRLEPESLGRSQVPEWRRAGAWRLLHLVRSMLADNLDRTLARVTCPVMVVRGGRAIPCTSSATRTRTRCPA